MILKGNSESLSVDHVTPTITLPTTPKIQLRQKSDASLAFVTIKNEADSATVTIDTTYIAIGTFSLELESFDSSASPPQATLKTDITTIFVI